MILETLQNNLELFLAVVSNVGVVAFIYVLVSAFKTSIKKYMDVYTPVIAIVLGMFFGVYIMTALFGFDWILTLMGAIQGALLGASAVGLHQLGNQPEPKSETVESTGQGSKVVLPEEIKDILNYE